MSYQAPMLIREPELRWPRALVAAVVTTLSVLLMAGVLRLAQTQPAGRPTVEPRLEGALRPEMQGFEQLLKRSSSNS